MRYFDLLKKRAEERKHYLDNLEAYLSIIKKFFKEKLCDFEIYLFGSILRDDFGPDSDVDILVISKNTPPFTYERSKLILELKRIIGFVNPFEIHIITPEEYEEWYSKFIKEKKPF